MILKAIATIFVLFAISRVWLRYRDGQIGMLGMTLWSCIWLAIAGVVWWPAVTNLVANAVGVGRGSDAIVYVSVVTLFYAMFRLYVKLEYIEHELTSLVRNLALKEKADSGQKQ